MCGIIGVLLNNNAKSNNDAVPIVFDGLKRLEYRGYDSAGIAAISDDAIKMARAEGKLNNLANELKNAPLSSNIAIGHTRWATHGVPSEINAHPHGTSQVAVVHNGIIENFQQLRENLEAKGHDFKSDTDTEVIPILITDYLQQGYDEHQAFSNALGQLEGAYGLAVIFLSQPDKIYIARHGSPLAVGLSSEEQLYVASDALALAPLTSNIIYLQDGDWAILDLADEHVKNMELLCYQQSYVSDNSINNDGGEKTIIRKAQISAVSGAVIGKDNYRHFMHKEIHEQPTVLGETLNAYYNPKESTLSIPNFDERFYNASRFTIIACGTSYYAGMVGKYWLEQVAGIPVEVDIASEFRYREGAEKTIDKNSAILAISQSGETADSLAALRLAKNLGIPTISLINSIESSMARESDLVLRSYAGPEIGVASTKAFTTQLLVIMIVAIKIAMIRGNITSEYAAKLCHMIAEIPALIAELLSDESHCHHIAQQIATARDVLYMGRGSSYPIALEGALKLKEISYIHAEGYAAGELKHGPIALIDENVPIIALIPDGKLSEKSISNLQEAAARGGRIILISNERICKQMKQYSVEQIIMPNIDELLAPILYAIPVQLLAYHTAVIKGTDIDQPRNLAKSVTVE